MFWRNFHFHHQTHPWFLRQHCYSNMFVSIDKTKVSHPEHIALRQHIPSKYWYSVYRAGECCNLHSYHHVNLKSQSYVKVAAVGHCTKLAFAFSYSHPGVRPLHIPFCVLFAFSYSHPGVRPLNIPFCVLFASGGI